MDHITGTIYQKGIKQNIFALTMATYRTNVCGTKKANTKKKKNSKQESGYLHVILILTFTE